MRQVYRINLETGWFMEPVVLNGEECLPKDCVVQSFPEGMYQPHYVN